MMKSIFPFGIIIATSQIGPGPFITPIASTGPGGTDTPGIAS